MANLGTQERLQPSLLDRLTDEDPDSKEATTRVLSMQQIRTAVQRDLAWLLNTGRLSSTEDLGGYPEVETSVLNFGIPDLAGLTVHGANKNALEEALAEAIRSFEPRILKNSLKVRVVTDTEEMHRNAVVFEIEGKLWSEPAPVRLLWDTEVDLETGNVVVTESRGK